jgi:proton glutamate symport protein
MLGRVSAKRFAEAAFRHKRLRSVRDRHSRHFPDYWRAPTTSSNARSQVAGFVLPLAVSIFKITTPVVWLAGAYFVAHLYGVSFDARSIALILVASVELSFASPGIPMGSLALLAALFASAGLPVEGIGVLIAVVPGARHFQNRIERYGRHGGRGVLSRQHELWHARS